MHCSPMQISCLLICQFWRQKIWPNPHVATPLIRTDFNWPCSSVHGSGWMCPGSSGSRSRCALTDILEALTLLGRVWFMAWCLRRPFLGECQRGPRHFWRRVWATALRPVPPKKALYHTRPLSGTYDKYRRTKRWSLGLFFCSLSGRLP